MLENYAKDHNDVIYQINREPFSYDYTYIQTSYGGGKAPVDEMAHLRLGYLIGSLGRTPDSILDVGYGAGNFLKAAKNIIPKCYGYDIPPAYPINNIDIVDNIYSKNYDIVTFFDSLEHFTDIYEINNLKCNGILISLPWCHYINDHWFSQWKHRKPDEHLWHFNIDSLKKFMKSIGFSYKTHSNIEDTIRRSSDNLPNILTALFLR